MPANNMRPALTTDAIMSPKKPKQDASQPKRDETARVSPQFRSLVRKAAALREKPVGQYLDPFLRGLVDAIEKRVRKEGLLAVSGIGGGGVPHTESTTILIPHEINLALTRLAGLLGINVAALLNDRGLLDAIRADYVIALKDELGAFKLKVSDR